MSRATSNPPSVTTAEPEQRLFAFKEVEEQGVKVKVYPLSYRVFQAHADEVMSVVNALGHLDTDKLRAAGVDGSSLWLAIAPVVGRKFLDIISASCVPTLDQVDAPIGMMTRIAAAWFDVSFRDGGFEQIELAAAALLAQFSRGGGSTANTRPGSSDLGSASSTSSGAPVETDTRKEG